MICRDLITTGFASGSISDRQRIQSVGLCQIVACLAGKKNLAAHRGVVEPLAAEKESLARDGKSLPWMYEAGA
jgi:hypothetical protein